MERLFFLFLQHPIRAKLLRKQQKNLGLWILLSTQVLGAENQGILA